MVYYDYLPELHNRLIKTRNRVKATPDRIDELLPLLDDVPFEKKDHFELELEMFLIRLRDHHEVWRQVLLESRKRKRPRIRRVK